MQFFALLRRNYGRRFLRNLSVCLDNGVSDDYVAIGIRRFRTDAYENIDGFWFVLDDR